MKNRMILNSPFLLEYYVRLVKFLLKKIDFKRNAMCKKLSIELYVILIRDLSDI